MENPSERKDNNLLEVNIIQCPHCGNFRGTVCERNNGELPVLCKCDLDGAYSDSGQLPSPSMISPEGSELWCTPTTEYKTEDGDMIHAPYFSAPLLVNKFNPSALNEAA